MRLAISVWGATLLIAFFLGWFSHGIFQPKVDEPAHLAAAAEPGKQDSPVSKGKVTAAGSLPPINLEAWATEKLGAGETAGRLGDPIFSLSRSSMVSPDSLFESTDPLSRMGKFIDVLRNLNENNIEGVLEAFEKLPENQGRAQELKLLFCAWGRFDAKAAIAYAENMGPGEKIFASRAALASWATKEPKAALNWADSQEDPQKISEYVVGIVEGVATNDMKAATELMFSIDQINYRYQAASLLVKDNLQRGIDHTLQWAESLPESDPAVKRNIYTQVASALAKEDPRRGAEWAMKVSEGETRSSVIATVINYWARESNQEAAEWVQQLPEGDSRYKAIEQMVNQWAWRDPASTAEWLNQFPATTKMDSSIDNFARRIASKEPEIAADWANSIQDDSRKQRAIEYVYQNWKSRNAAEANAWATLNAPHLAPKE